MMVLLVAQKLAKFAFIIFLFSTPILKCFAQTLSAELNPGCKNCLEKQISFLSICYRGVNSSVHFIVAMQNEKFTPSVFIGESSRNSSVVFDWNAIVNKNTSKQSIHLENASFSGILFSTLYNYEDVNDVADVSKAVGKVEKLLTKYIFWNLTRYDHVVNPSTNLLSVVIRGYDAAPFKLFRRKGGYVEIEFAFADKDQYPDRAPYTLLVGGLATRVKVTFKLMHIPYKTSRWALGMVLAANVTLPDCVPFNHSSTISIDDEPSPGSFKDMTVHLGAQSYAAWRSVCFEDPSVTELKTSRAVTVSAQACLDRATNRSLRKASLLPFVYGPTVSPALRQINVSFGDPGDGFYAASNYLDWSFTFGVGASKASQFSSLFYGLFFLIVAVLLASLGLIVHFITAKFDCNSQRTDYERQLLDDDNADGNDVDNAGLIV